MLELVRGELLAQAQQEGRDFRRKVDLDPFLTLVVRVAGDPSVLALLLAAPRLFHRPDVLVENGLGRL